MKAVDVKSARDGAELSLGLAPERRKEDGYYLASLRGPSMAATVEVYDLDVANLVSFFAELGDKWWNGWPDEKTYRSVEGHLELKATRDKLGHVFLRVMLRDGLGCGDWTAGGTLELEAGRLPEVAAAVKNVFASP